MLAENVSLGVLALPQALAVLGILPGMLCICFLGIIATYTGYLVGEFKLAHPSVQSYADCGQLMSGRIAHEAIAVAQVLVLIFIMGAHIVTFAVAMNAMTNHSTCTIIFSVIGLFVSFVLGLPRTFKNISYFSMFCKSRHALMYQRLSLPSYSLPLGDHRRYDCYDCDRDPEARYEQRGTYTTQCAAG